MEKRYALKYPIFSYIYLFIAFFVFTDFVIIMYKHFNGFENKTIHSGQFNVSVDHVVSSAYFLVRAVEKKNYKFIEYEYTVTARNYIRIIGKVNGHII